MDPSTLLPLQAWQLCGGRLAAAGGGGVDQIMETDTAYTSQLQSHMSHILKMTHNPAPLPWVLKVRSCNREPQSSPISQTCNAKQTKLGAAICKDVTIQFSLSGQIQQLLLWAPKWNVKIHSERVNMLIRRLTRGGREIGGIQISRRTSVSGLCFPQQSLYIMSSWQIHAPPGPQLSSPVVLNASVPENVQLHSSYLKGKLCKTPTFQVTSQSLCLKKAQVFTLNERIYLCQASRTEELNVCEWY